MMNTYEGTVMVKPINEANSFGRIDTDKRVSATSTRGVDKSAAESNDIVSFSDVSKQMSALKAIISDVPDINAARIEFLKEEYLAGRYQANSNAIAQRMIADIEMA